MKKAEEYLSGIKLPVYVLFRNLRFEHDFDIDSPVARGELVSHHESFDKLKSMIPRPNFPDDEYKISLLDSKYGQITENELEYDDTVFDIAEGGPSDYEIFGESYTIVYFCQPDEEFLVQFLMDIYKKERDLLNIWINYFDRMHIYPFYSLEVTSDNFIESLDEQFRSAVNKLPQPPSTEEWDELNEYL